MGFISRCRQFFTRSQSDAKRRAIYSAAEGGDAEAQFGLGLRCSLAIGGKTDFPQAAQWYRKAADQDHSLAQFNLGVMLAAGQGMARDDVAAVGWFRKAARGGDAAAQFKLGSRSQRHSVERRGKDAAEARVEAFKWLHLAASQGYDGSSAACERVTLGMSREEVADGQRRAASYAADEPFAPSISKAE